MEKFKPVWKPALVVSLGMGCLQFAESGLWWTIPVWPAALFLMMFVAMGATHCMEKE